MKFDSLLQYTKGREFESYVAGMFPTRDFEILQRADLEGSKIPDLYIKDLKMREKFWVEAKWRRRLYNEKYKICDANRLESYKTFQASVKPETVFMVLGLGGEPSTPNEVFCLPVSKIEYPELFLSRLIPVKHEHATFRYDRGRLY
jgi:hypothetical protein